MTGYQKNIDIRWSDIDANLHLRHSAYYDFGAYCRMCFLVDHEASMEKFTQYKVGPILLREECVFKRELHFGDVVQINIMLKKATNDLGRWTIVHEIWKNIEKLAAIITVDGAWMDTEKRKIASPPVFAAAAFNQLEKTTDFQWI